MSLSHSELCHQCKCNLCFDFFDRFDNGSFIREASNKNPQSAAAGRARMSPCQSLCKDVKGGAVNARDSQSGETKKIKQKKGLSWFKGAASLWPLKIRDRGTVWGSEPGKSKGKKTFGCQRPETAASTFFFFPQRHTNNVPSQFWSIFTKEMWKSVCCLELNIQEELDVKGVTSELIASLLWIWSSFNNDSSVISAHPDKFLFIDT